MPSAKSIIPLSLVVIVFIDSLLRSHTKSLCLPPLAVGIGIYLPSSLQTPLVVGAIMSYFLERRMRNSRSDVDAGKQRGTLFASGLIVGESIVGVLLAAVIAVSVSGGGSDAPLALAGEDFQDTAEVLGLMAFFTTLAVFGKIVLKK